MVEWKINKARDLQLKLLVFGMPITLIIAILLLYYRLLPLVELYIFIICLIIIIIMYGPGTFLVWKFVFSKNPKYIGISNNGIHFSINEDEFEDYIYWKDIKKIKYVKNPQEIEVKTIFLKDGSKRELKGIDENNIKRITKNFEKYK